MDKVGKQEGAEQKAKEEAIVEQGEKAKAEQIRKDSSVQELEEKNKIDVNKDGHKPTDFKQQNQKKAKPTQKADSEEFFTDPSLGRKIDFSG